jgi:hypothetical protein
VCYDDVMNNMYPNVRASRVVLARPIVALACAVAVPWLALAPAAMGATTTVSSTSVSQAVADAGATAGAGAGQTAPSTGKASASATLQQCATATIPQTERSATFAGEMSAIPGTARMQIRIELEERALGESMYHTVTATGLGVWHSSAAGVKIFAHIQQVTNLSAPAVYRGAVRFRWLNAKGHPIKTQELRTARCEQPATQSPAAGSGPTSAAPTGTTTGTTTGAST